MGLIKSYEPRDFLAKATLRDASAAPGVKIYLKEQIDAEIAAAGEIKRYLVPLEYEEMPTADGGLCLGWFAKAMVHFATVDSDDIPEGLRPR